MKRKYLYGAIALALVTTAFVLGQVDGAGGLMLATVGAGAAAVAGAETRKHQFKADDKGNVTISVAELEEFTKETASEAAKNLIRELALNVAPAPAGLTAVGDMSDAKALAIEPADEKPAAKQRRLSKALVEFGGGRLAIEDAPKQIKFNRWLQGLYEADREVVKALGPGSWGESRVKALTEGSAADGGNLVPIEFATDLLVAIEEFGTCSRDCLIVPMTTQEKDLRTVTTKPTVTRKGELVASDESATKFGKPQLIADAYVGHQIISREEMDDNNVGLYDRMVELFGEQMAFVQDDQGLVQSYYPGVLQVVGTTATTLLGNTAGDITYSKLLELKNSLSAGKLARGGKFYMHRTVMGLIEGMEDSQGRPIVQNTFGPFGPTLFGFPVELNEVMPTSAVAANTAFIIFGNLKWMAFGQRQGVFQQLLREATLPKAGGGSVNLASERAIALMVDMRFGFKATIAANMAVLKTGV